MICDKLDLSLEKKANSFLEGERVYLRSLLEKDADGPYAHWLNDGDICRGTSHGIRPYSTDKALEYIKYANSTEQELILAIICKRQNLHIGNIALQKINWIFRSAELAILLGDKNYWGKGYGLEAARLLIQHGFSSLNLNRIGCGTFENNLAMQKLALSLGMQQEGLRRKAVFKDGNYLDIVEFGLLKNEYKIEG